MGPAIAPPLFSLESILYQGKFSICPGFTILKTRESCIALVANFCQRQITSSLKDSTTGGKLVQKSTNTENAPRGLG